jgi:hypothetical protein
MNKLITLALTGYFGVMLLAVIGLGGHWHATGLPPEQPIAFSHKLHLNTVGLTCTHCHQYADKGLQATVPAMSICMECHKDVKTDSPEIQKLTHAWDEGKGVEWVKVHDVPWHVHFTHKRHIKAGIQCASCHGEVQAMDQMRQVRSLEMGWCVSCHRLNAASTDCLTCHK